MSTAPSQRFLGLQALRMIAALLVVYMHATLYTSERLDKSVSVWGRGARGVDIFFVISGFVMIYASRKLVLARDGWKIFAESRIARIVPLYWLVTTLKILVLLLTAGLALHANLTPAKAIYSYLFLPTRNLDGKIYPLVAVGWTLNFEMLFYFLFTLALFLRVNVYKFIGITLTALAVGAYFRHPSWPPIAFYMDSIVLEFFFGMMIAKACINGFHCPKKAALWLLALGFFLLMLRTADGPVPKALINGVPASLIVWAAASLGSLEKFIPRIALYLGDASYSIYLIHPFIAPLPPTVLHRIHMVYPGLSIVLGVTLGLGLGCLLHHFIELPIMIRLKPYLKASPRLPEAATARYGAA